MPFVQLAANNVVGATSIATTINGQIGGNFNLALLWSNSTTTAVSTFQDQASHAYTLITSLSFATPVWQMWAYDLSSIPVGNNTVTATMTVSASYELIIMEYSQIKGVDVSRTDTGTSQNPVTGSLTTTFATDILVCFATLNTANFSSTGSGYVLRGNQSAGTWIEEEQTAGQPGAYTASLNTSSSNNWATILIAMQQSAGALSSSPACWGGGFV